MKPKHLKALLQQARAQGVPLVGQQPRTLKDFPPGTIGVPTGFLARYTSFFTGVMGMKAPPGSAYQFEAGCYVEQGRDKLALTFEGEWLCFVDDDMIVRQDTLARLLLADKDIIVPLCVTRGLPFRPALYEPPKLREDGTVRFPHHYLGADDQGLREVGGAGMGMMLVKRRVFEALPKPPFSHQAKERGWGMGEDLWFCWLARQAGIAIWCDFDTPIGHSTPMSVWPTHGSSGEWMTGIQMDEEASVLIPAASAREKGDE